MRSGPFRGARGELVAAALLLLREVKVRTGVPDVVLGVWGRAARGQLGAPEPGRAPPSDVRIARREGTRHG
ncbi:hypothetical protein [Streptomyces mirabilis]|uniref:hypothetical protein n=1 Tax=Streptomyces mirabilis TaxID=68239 RepID=UPI0036E06596